MRLHAVACAPDTAPCKRSQLEEWHRFFTAGEGASQQEGASSTRAYPLDSSGEGRPPAELKFDLPEGGFPPNLRPHAWLAPSVVWEVKAAALSLSPVFRAGRSAVFGGVGGAGSSGTDSGTTGAMDGRGLSLKFPRFLRPRHDKSLGETTTSDQLVTIFAKQPEAEAALTASACATTAVNGADALVEADGVVTSAESVGGGAGPLSGLVRPPADKAARLEVYGVAASKSGGKFWSGAVINNEVHCRYGKVGKAGQTKVHTCESEEAAVEKLRNLQADKEKKSYAFDA